MSNKVVSVRLFPTKDQENSLVNMNITRNIIWNNLINIIEEHHKKTEKYLSKFELDKFLPDMTEKDPSLKLLNSKAAQVVSRQVSGSIKSFFQLKKNGDHKAKPPGLIDINKLTSITLNQSGWTFKKHHVKLSKIKEPIYFKSKYDLRNLDIKEVVIKKKNNKWLCDLVIEENLVNKVNNNNNILALDLGLKTLATGIDSSGEVIKIKNEVKKISKYFISQISEVSKKISTKTKGSKRYYKLNKTRNKLYHKKNTQVKQTLHIQSKQLVNMNYKTIVIGDLSVKELMSKDKSFKTTRKTFANSAIDMFRTFLKYKCQGRTNVVEIDEKYTTQLNCLTGELFPEHIDLSKREVEITDKIVIDRDLNSAINIYNRYKNKNLAELTPPLDLSNVLKRNNIFLEKKSKL